MKLNKSILTGSMVVILIALAYSWTQKSLIGTFLCFGATTGLFIFTNRKRVQK